MADEKEIDDWRDTFSLFDKKGNGNVECCEIGEMLRALGQNPTQGEVKRIINEIDPQGEKEISFEEFLPLMHIERKKPGLKQDFASFCEGFKVFDRDNNGMVNVAEIRNILTSMGEVLTSVETDLLLEGMEDNNGQVNYEEFIRVVTDA